MEDVGHSALLKFLVSDTKMSEPSNIESEVPGEQKLREGGSSADNENSTLNPSDKAESSLQETSTNDFSLEPVITVTKQETTLTKGEMKLQKVTVTEDISQSSEVTKTSGAVNRRLTYEVQTKIPSPTNTNSKRDDAAIATHTTEKENIESRKGKTKIPRARFRQAVDRVKREQRVIRETKGNEITSTPRKSSIPRLRDSKIPHQLTSKEMNVSKEVEDTAVPDEDEFDKIFREINEKSSNFEVSISNEECVSQVESSFDEIIHAYEEDVKENVQVIGADRVKQSRIPMLKRKSEHDIEMPRNRERHTIKKSISVDMDKDGISATQTEYTSETVTTEDSQGYTETSTENVTFRRETSFSNEYNIKKRQGITCDESVYDRILITDETFEDAEERYRLSKFKQGGIDSDEAVPIIDEPQVTAETGDATESYDDISMTSETQLTKISSEQVRFDKQIVSKIYKIDFTENTFELGDSETTESLNGHTQEMTEGASNKTITRSISKEGSISMLVDHRKTDDVVGDFKVSRYKTSSYETTRDSKDAQKVRKSYTVESVQSSVTTNELSGQRNTKHLIETSGSIKNYAVSDVKDQINIPKNITESIGVENSVDSNNTEKNIENFETKCSINEIKEEATKDGEFTNTDSIVKINDTEKTATYLAAKHSPNEIKDTAISNTANTIKCTEEEYKTSDFATQYSTKVIKDSTDSTIHLTSQQTAKEMKETGNASASLVTNMANTIKCTKEESKTSDFATKYSTKDIKDSTDSTTHLTSQKTIKEIKETGNASASLITEENNETKNTPIKETDSITIGIIKDDKYMGTTASALVRNVSTEIKKETRNNETNIIMKQNFKGISSEINTASELYVKQKTEDVMNTPISTAEITQSINDAKLTSDITSNKIEENETKITKNALSSNKETVLESPTTKYSLNSYETSDHSYSPKQSLKTEVNGSKADHDEETIKIYSDVFSKMSTATLPTKVPTAFESKTENSEKIEDSIKTSNDRNNKLSVLGTGSDPEENIPILRGKVSRIIGRISSIDNSKTEDKEAKDVKDVPKKKSILSKIALFERDEPYERIPKPKGSQPEPKPLRGLAALRQTSRELRKPKIVDEIYKEYSERSAVRQGTKLQSENDEEEITIEIKDVKNEAEVNRFDSAFKAKLYDIKITKDESQDIPKTENFFTHEEIGIKEKGVEEKEQEEIVIVKNISNEDEDSTFKPKLTDYKTLKNDFLRRAKSESFSYREEKKIGESAASNASTSDLVNGLNKSPTKENIIVKSEETVSTIHNDSSFKINNSATSNNISNGSNNFKRTISSPTHLVNEKYSTGSNNSLKISDRRIVNEVDKYKKRSELVTTGLEEPKEIINDKMVRRMRSRDPVVQRAISVVEDDLGEVIKGKVKGIISRINSMEKIELARKRNEERNTFRGSVSQRIALFEGKASMAKAEKSTEARSWRNRTVEAAPKEMDDETCKQRIEELKEAKKMYGFTNGSYIELRDGTKMPVIALGTALLDKRLVRQVVETAIDLGYRAIDTAFIYGNEKEIGEAINAKINDGTVKREDLYIISKLWSTFHRRDLVERACRASLDIMGLYYFDLYLIHNPMSLKEGGDPIPKIANVLQFSEHDFMDAWYGIEDLVTKGLVRSAGLSNFNSEQIHRVAEKGRLKPVVNQVECHPYLSQDRLAGFCDAYGMKLVCFGTLGSKGTPKNLKSTLPPAIEDPLVQVMAAGLGVTPALLLVAYQVRKGRGVVAKASTALHLHENLAAQRLPLAAGQLTALGALDRHKRTYTFEGMGETHKNYPFKIAF